MQNIAEDIFLASEAQASNISYEKLINIAD
jgi:hypothetical protein